MTGGFSVGLGEHWGGSATVWPIGGGYRIPFQVERQQGQGYRADIFASLADGGHHQGDGEDSQGGSGSDQGIHWENREVRRLNWLQTLRSLLFQPRHDERVNILVREVEGVKREQRGLNRRVEALEAAKLMRRITEGGGK